MTRFGAVLLCVGAVAAAYEVVTAQSAPAPGSPRVVALGPGSGRGAGRTFSFVYSDPDGGSDILTAEGLIVTGTQVVGVNSCYFFASGNQFWLRNDAHTAWLGPATSGTADVISNSQCALSAAGSSMSASGTSLTMAVTVTFMVPFAGDKSVFMKATDRSGLASDWIRGGTWTVSPLNPPMEVITSSCADSSRDPLFAVQYVPEQGGRFQRLQYIPPCFPTHSFYNEGIFVDSIDPRRPAPVMGRMCGHFDVLVAFTDNDFNRRKLLDNPDISAAAKAKIANGQVQEGLTDYFAGYTAGDIMSGLRREAASAVSFTFTVKTTPVRYGELQYSDPGLGFANYDAVVLLDDLVTVSGIGVRRWPWARHNFDGKNGGFFLNLDPFRITPGLFGNELLRRNLPTLLTEYTLGATTLVTVGSTVFDRTPIINPRTGENIEPLIRANEGKISIGVYLAGWADVDGDGIIDCVDPVIAPTADNVDGDFIPDRFDPDLKFKHQPYSWLLTTRGGR